MELKGKNAIVTGAARGIGRGIALKLAEAGANVALVDMGNPADRTLTYNLAAQTGAVEEFGEEQWDRVMAVNAKGPFLCAKACIPHMKRKREGAIINTASIAGKTGFGGVSAYCASKFAVVAFTQSLAEELGPANIRVNAVCPGILRTAMWTDVLNKVPGFMGAGEGDNLSIFAAMRTHLRREQTPDDIGEAVVFLARADDITGVALNVAGGAEVH